MTARIMVSDWQRVGGDFSVQFKAAPGDARLDCEWQPRLPTKREFDRHVDGYRQARDAFLGSVSQQLGRDILVLEV